jgi:hypothetical protein
MPITRPPAPSRRDFLQTGGAVGAAAALLPGNTAEPAAVRLTAAPTRKPMVGAGHPATAVLSYNG